jgi:hypothetical protein
MAEPKTQAAPQPAPKPPKPPTPKPKATTGLNPELRENVGKPDKRG